VRPAAAARRLADLLEGHHNGHDDDLDNGDQIVVTEPDGTGQAGDGDT
jgi:hypothetical protein